MNKLLQEINHHRKNYLIISLGLLCLFGAKATEAASLSVKVGNENILAGDTVVAEVMMNTDGEDINVVEGSISVPANGVTIKQLNTANSVLNYWVRNPSWSEKDKTISFVGGAPGGFNQKSASLFKIYFTVESNGNVSFLPESIKAYANDGVATPVAIKTDDLTVEVKKSEDEEIKDEWVKTVYRDTEGPTNIVFDLGQDDSLFDGQKFIVISASDSGSGLDYFEVKEGNRSPVRTSGNYVLQNQDKLEVLTIFAFDKSGNVTRRSLLVKQSHSTDYLYLALYGLILLMFLVGMFFLVRRVLHRKKKNKK